MRTIYNEAWRNNWGFVPFTEAEFDDLAREMKPLLRPELGYIAEDGGRPVGFILALPDINVVLKQINGRLTKFGIPIGLAKLLYYKGRIKRVRLITLGVIDAYRRRGIAEALVLRIIEAGMIARGVVGEQSMTLEDNVAMNGFLEAIGAKRYKTYRIFRRRLGAQ
jgi:GNAT superfamily N-acetyltransferase